MPKSELISIQNGAPGGSVAIDFVQSHPREHFNFARFYMWFWSDYNISGYFAQYDNQNDECMYLIVSLNSWNLPTS